ncbi:hypothetical protein COHA_010493 [Chlorella ohadii]|uniref:Uncharacterized protein n=1 Tax=Chlorella ohadii TaxID=2649997 RepID=A0AAD5DFA6_9CHLO|nr:hypothetical protein COHA_010493 [Chlorella ohadii]
MQASPYTDEDGQDVVQLSPAIRADNILYHAEYKAVLRDTVVLELLQKLERIRLARAGESPDLAADLEGITHVKLFACGGAVRRGRTAEQIVELAAAQGLSISVLMPSGEALSLVGGAAPAVQL